MSRTATASVMKAMLRISPPHFGPKEFDDVVDDLTRYILGVDDDFDWILNRR